MQVESAPVDIQKDSPTVRDDIRNSVTYRRTTSDPQLRNALVTYARSTR
jgi:hypothetical protein